MPDNQAIFEKLQQPASLRWVLACLLNWVVIVGAFYSSFFFQSLWVDFFVILIVGNRQHAIALLGHEGAHYMLSANRGWNDFLTSILAFWPLGINLPGYRKFHFLHHLKVGTASDPELLHKNMKFPDYELPINRYKMALFFIKDLLCLSVYEVLILISFDRQFSLDHYYLYHF